MRLSAALLLALAACGQPAPATPRPVEHHTAKRAPDRAPDPDPRPDPASDPDNDRIVGACDLCPNDPETWNAILDEDGCPDSSGTSHAVIEDPTNHFAGPTFEILFPIGVTSATVSAQDIATLKREIQERRVQAINCVGQAAPEENRAAVLARRRGGTVCSQLRAAGITVPLIQRSAGSGPIRKEGSDRAPSARTVVQVVRANSVQIWRWDGKLLVRDTPPRRLEYPKPLDPACIAP